MFQGPAYGGLVAGPTTGATQANPAELIPNDGLAIAQINELRSQLDGKRPLFGLDQLSLAHTAGLETALSERATTEALSAGLAAKQDALTASSSVEVDVL